MEILNQTNKYTEELGEKVSVQKNEVKGCSDPGRTREDVGPTGQQVEPVDGVGIEQVESPSSLRIPKLDGVRQLNLR